MSANAFTGSKFKAFYIRSSIRQKMQKNAIVL